MNQVLCPIFINNINSVNFPNNPKKCCNYSKISPKYECKEVSIIFLSDTVIGELAMVIHIYDTSITASTMINSIMLSFVATALACVHILVMFSAWRCIVRFCFIGNYITWVRLLSDPHSMEDKKVCDSEEANPEQRIECPPAIFPH